MNSSKVVKGLSPLLIALVFVFSSYSIAIGYEDRTVYNLFTFGLIELYSFYLVLVFKMNAGKKKLMCTILAISMSVCTFPFTVVTYIYVNTDNYIVDAVHNFMYETHSPLSYAISIMLIMVSILPGKKADDLCSMGGINSLIGGINRYFKVCFFGVKGFIR